MGLVLANKMIKFYCLGRVPFLPVSLDGSLTLIWRCHRMVKAPGFQSEYGGLRLPYPALEKEAQAAMKPFFVCLFV